MDPLTLAIVKTIASACLKFYLSSLMAGSGLSYKSSELGYKVPKWYMKPGRTTAFYSYGTSIEGDEFQSIEAARQLAIKQMVTHMRLGNERMIQEEVSFDRSSIKQKRLIDLFVRGDGLEKFVLMHAQIDKKQLVKVETPEEDMRAFVRLTLKASDYIDFQEESVQKLKSRIMHQKTDDILSEMDAEVKAYKSLPEGAEAPPEEVEPQPQPEHPVQPPASSSGGFGDLESELDSISK